MDVCLYQLHPQICRRHEEGSCTVFSLLEDRQNFAVFSASSMLRICARLQKFKAEAEKKKKCNLKHLEKEVQQR